MKSQEVMGEVRFARAGCGARIAYTVKGSGPPLVIVPPWTTHLAAQVGLSGHERFHAKLESQHTVVLYDRWGTGLSRIGGGKTSHRPQTSKSWQI